MGEAVIQVEGLGKRYRVGERERYRALRDVLARAMRAPFTRRERRTKDWVWAVREVSFEVRGGEVVGLIGRNGAGKSTLLKLLSRITRPTAGFAEIRGRVGSLLEVGTGFHPELTGRENVFLSGAILGMKRREISRKFDEIVAFAEVERFLDTPLKHYSSGMQMRLAFAVAAHLEPEILLVDEVLAVGDIAFQKKCLGKMGEVARCGRTVVLVSHNMAAVNALCARCVILREGSIEFDGATREATQRFYAELLDLGSGFDLRARPREGSGKGIFTSLAVEPLDASGDPVAVATPGCDLAISIEIEGRSRFAHANVALIFYDAQGYRILDANTAQRGEFLSLDGGQTAKVRFLLKDVLLRPGKYILGLWLGREGVEEIDHIEHAMIADIAEGPESSDCPVLYPGTYLCRFEQKVSVLENSSAGVRS